MSKPDLSERERAYLLDAFDSTWVSSAGEYVGRFERDFAAFVGTKHALTCTNGTCALHLAMLACDVGPGDEVIVPDLTYVATANAVRYVGATPVFADCDDDTWIIDPKSVQRLVTEKTKAIVAVHLLGGVAEMDALRQIARDENVFLIEDAAEAHGATWRGTPVGGLGDLATFSFFGNKIITTGEGGMVTTDDDHLARRVEKFKTQGLAEGRPYYFDEIGFNYRMTNLACAIGVAQLERVESFLTKRNQVAGYYDKAIAQVELPLQRQGRVNGAEPVNWIYGVRLAEAQIHCRDVLTLELAKRGVETRPMFHPISDLPIYIDSRTDGGNPLSKAVGSAAVMLPTHTQMSEADCLRVVHEIERVLCSVRQVL